MKRLIAFSILSGVLLVGSATLAKGPETPQHDSSDSKATTVAPDMAKGSPDAALPQSGSSTPPRADETRIRRDLEAQGYQNIGPLEMRDGALETKAFKDGGARGLRIDPVSGRVLDER
jgi:hypothetical protein